MSAGDVATGAMIAWALLDLTAGFLFLAELIRAARRLGKARVREDLAGLGSWTRGSWKRGFWVAFAVVVFAWPGIVVSLVRISLAERREREAS